jgi:hypothetical protein
VMVHGMKVSSVDCSDQKEAIRQIMGQNAQLQNRVEILRVQWPKRAAKLSKASSHLLLHLASPEQLNILVDEGLLFHSELRQCELYHGDFTQSERNRRTCDCSLPPVREGKEESYRSGL